MATIGFGDVPADVPLARAVLVVLSLVSVLYLAVLTGSFASYCTNIMQSRAKNTVVFVLTLIEDVQFIDLLFETISALPLWDLAKI